MISNELLKQRILDMAVHGTLIKNNLTFEKFDIKKISKIKEEKIKAGILNKEKELDSIEFESIPFKIPDNWIWVRLGSYCEKITDQVASGSFASLRENVPSLKDEDYAIMVKTADFRTNFQSNLTYTNEHGYNFLSNSNLFGGELILSNVGSIGKVFIVPKLNKKMTLAPNSVMIRFTEDRLRNYIYYYLLSPFGYSQLMSITTGTAMQKFNKTDLKKILVPIPPLEEQEKIVKKINELFELIDKKEKNDKEKEKLKTLLKEKILDSAIRGELVENDLSLQSVDVEEVKENVPFEIPNNWKYTYLNNIGIWKAGSTPLKDNLDYYKDGNIPWILTGDLNDGILSTCKHYITEKAFNECSLKLNKIGSVLIAMYGATIGKVAISSIKATTNQACCACECYDKIIYNKYLFYYLISVREELKAKAEGAGQPNISKQKIINHKILLPPLEQQKKIVEKIEKCFELIEQL